MSLFTGRKKAKFSSQTIQLNTSQLKVSQLLESALKTNYGVCLVGPPASGKTSIVHKLSETQGQEVISLFVDSSIDGRTLLGTYLCTEVPGEFVWSPGVLSQAASQGKWLLVENLHTLPQEIQSLLNDFLETGRLHIPNRGENIYPQPGFKVIATSESALKAAGQWILLNIEKVTSEDLFEMVKGSQVLKECLLEVYQGMSEIKGRAVTPRDWLKLNQRCQHHLESLYGVKEIQNNLLTEKLKEMVFLESMEVFSGTRNSEECITLLSLVLKIPFATLHALYFHRLPKISSSSTSLQLGKAPQIPSFSVPSFNFAKTPYTLRLLEALCSGVANSEPLLLVGETGNGKTTMAQYLAEVLNVKLYVHNLSQVSDPTDIIGGFKPVAVSTFLSPLIAEFLEVLPKYLETSTTAHRIRKAYTKNNWSKVIHCIQSTLEALSPDSCIESLKAKTEDLSHKISQSAFAFQFVEGSLVKAIKEGSWILLEEINLAEDEVLERLHSVLEGKGLTLFEKADATQIPVHPNFRLLGCMNPGKQVGKKELPFSLRNKFTELWVEEMQSYEDVLGVVSWYLQGFADRNTVENVVQFYLKSRELCKEALVEDGRGRVPQYSLRTLCRALKYSKAFSSVYGFQTSLYEGLKLFFKTPLKEECSDRVQKLLLKPKTPQKSQQPSKDHLKVFGYWVEKGPNAPLEDPEFIVTLSVEKHLKDLSRAVIFENVAVLLEGPTSSGKTSMVKYLAQLTGHNFLRINNHQHTDIEEYLGSYVSDHEGKLVFKEGPLVKAVREGYFVVLDELNLAPSEVLEALNRLLDDNRELLVPETQTTIKPHPHFRLFATQNPTAGYAGRKELSKAFRNRFVEMFVPEVPDDELIQVLEKRGKLAPSYAKVLISIMRDLQRHRQQTRAFLGKQGFITIRDLLKIAKREPVGYEQLTHLAYTVLGERLRTQEEADLVKQVIQSNCRNVKLDTHKFYTEYFQTAFSDTLTQELLETQNLGSINWNSHMKRLYCLVDIALKHNEPVLLVGETGCGKTTICQLLSLLRGKRLRCVNCHQHTETSDFIGSLRPVRAREALRQEVTCEIDNYIHYFPEDCQKVLKDAEKSLEEKFKVLTKNPNVPSEFKEKFHRAVSLFEWVDGPLIESYKEGSFLLIDEISLADDSVLERLNSVLESERDLVVPEKGGETDYEIKAQEGFQLLSTMNPGGDYGKKELSPALRNRFTEIWVQITLSEVEEVLSSQGSPCAKEIVSFMDWYNSNSRTGLSLRDAITWSEFTKNCNLPTEQAFCEGASLVLLDSLPNPQKAFSFIQESLGMHFDLQPFSLRVNECSFGIHPYYISSENAEVHYSFKGPSVIQNLYRVLRGMTLKKAILLEGPPGVGKTSIIEALGKATGHKVTRINMSDETDLIDLLGCDLPSGNKFEWCDGVLLSAIKAGHWIILDELNLCPQPVIEGLNALLDHRGTVYIPEINKEVRCPKSFRVFAAQNPLLQGGGRKGLPKSFLNRFTKIHIKELTKEDYLSIVKELYPQIDSVKIVEFNEQVKKKLQGPWEFNLRDVLRWCEGASPELLYYYRCRELSQKELVLSLYKQVFGCSLRVSQVPHFKFTPECIKLGNLSIPNNSQTPQLEFLPSQLAILHQLLESLRLNWPTLLVGYTGKTSLCRLAAELMQKPLHEYTLNPATDSSELLGSFEQNSQGQFEWFESTLVKAIKAGHWVLLKQANLCPAAVLDRINSLLEPNGSLLINERGLVDGESYVVTPHKDFRVVLSFDPSAGEVSRAIRNRCVELWVPKSYSEEDFAKVFGKDLLEKGTVEKLGFGELVKWGRVTQVSSMQEASELVFPQTEIQLKETGLKFCSLKEFITNPLEAYFEEDLQFAFAFGSEGLACYFSNSCLVDYQKRSAQFGLLSFNELFEKFLPTDNYSCVFDFFESKLDEKTILAGHLLTICMCTGNQLEYSLEIESLKNYLFYCLAKSDFTKYKLGKSLSFLMVPEPVLSKSFMDSWKSRVLSPSFRFTLDLPQIVTSDSAKSALESGVFSEPTNPYTVQIKDENYKNFSVGLILDKNSCLAEETKVLEEVQSLFEQVFFRFLTDCLNENNPQKFISQLWSMDYLPSSLLKPVWLLSNFSNFSREITLPILLKHPSPSVSFKNVYEGAASTSILNAPRYWFLLKYILKWPRSYNLVSIPESYYEELKQELGLQEGTCKGIAYGLGLFGLYRDLLYDPSSMYQELASDYNDFIQDITQRLQVRLNYYTLRYGYQPQTPLVHFYKKQLETFQSKLNKIQPLLIHRPLEFQAFRQQLNKLFSYNRLKQIIDHNLSQNNYKYIEELLNSFIEAILPFSESFKDLASPVLESLYLIRYSVQTLYVPPTTVEPFPYSVSNFPQSYQGSLILSHIFGTQDFTETFTNNLLSVLPPETQTNSLTIKLKKITEKHSVHTIGEKSKKQVDKEKAKLESQEIEEEFPSYSDEKAWEDSKRPQDSLVQAWKDWEFACGKRKHELEQRLIDSVPLNSSTHLTEQMEAHFRSLLLKLESTKTTKCYNFYTDSNPSETIKIYNPIAQLMYRVHSLLVEFPENGVLEEIQYLAYKVMLRPLFRVPLMQLISGVDILLKKANDWEEFAARHVSLKPQLQQVYLLLKTWQEIQLKNWEVLLEVKLETLKEKDVKLWSRLYKVLVCEKTQGAELFEVLDQYVRASSVGVFKHRLETLKLFGKMLSERCIKHIYNFYKEFEFEEYFKEQTKPIEAKISEVAKIARYDISNFHSWKNTTHRAHKQLNTQVKLYEELLKSPFQESFLRGYRESYCSDLLEKKIELLENLQGEETLESTISCVFERLSALSKEDSKSTKYSALKELFGAMKELGFYQFYKGSGLEFYSQPVFEWVPKDLRLLVSKAESYYYKCIDRLSTMHSSMGLNADLQTEDKERCLGLATHIMDTIIQKRLELYTGIQEYLKTVSVSDPVLTQAAQLTKEAYFKLVQKSLGKSIQIKTFKPKGVVFDYYKAEKALNSLKDTKYHSEALSILQQLQKPFIPPHNLQFPTLCYKSYSKLLYVVSSIFCNLFKEGFCKEPEEQESQCKGEELESGKGLGEGKGQEDISQELEDQEQFGDDKGEEPQEEGDAMDVDNDFQAQQEEGEAEDAEDQESQAQGEEKLLEGDQEVDQGEGQVRESANPEKSEETHGIEPQDEETQVEDFEMPGEIEEPSDSENLIDIEEKREDSEKESEASEASENEENEVQGSNQQENTEETQEEEKLEEFKDRDLMNYENDAYGVEDLKANTEKMMGESTDLNQESQTGSLQDVISQMKGEWSSQNQSKQSQSGPQSQEELEKNLENVQTINKPQNMEVEQPQSTDLYHFQEDAPDVTEAPSQTDNLPEKTPQKVELQEDTLAETQESQQPPTECLPNNTTQKQEKLEPNIEMYKFQEGSVGLVNKNKVTGEEAGLAADDLPEVVQELHKLKEELPDLQVGVDEWSHYEKETLAMSQELCEQLRIILEPTKAKGLQGDFKTGKRINIKKVIAYIASQFRKDKIWMRRSRATAREYQVLLAIDDSFSMLQHGLGDIAKKGLAVVAQALNKLEVGQMAVAAIREGMSLLHEMGASFSHEEGGFVMQNLKFEHGKHNASDMTYPNFMNQAINYMHSVGSSDMQLVIIISDGRLNKNKVRSWVRKAEDIFFLFVILDNPESSILNMKTTQFQTVQGKSQLKVYPYMEDFPFEYYVVVQNPASLVSTLADVIKQWFEYFKE